jgi:hypothetical protein
MNLDDPPRPRALGPFKAKIRPKDYPNIWFCTTEVSRFLDRFEAAADGEGAEDSDKVRQVVNFIQDVEDMKGYEKKEMLEKWGQSEQRYRESDLDKLAEEMAENGGVVTREQYGKYVSSFNRILRYLNQNEIVTDTRGAVKRTFIKAFPKEMRERAVRQLFERNLVKRSKDGGVIVLPDMKEIRKALLGEMDMREVESEDQGRLGVRSRCWGRKSVNWRTRSRSCACLCRRRRLSLGSNQRAELEWKLPRRRKRQRILRGSHLEDRQPAAIAEWWGTVSLSAKTSPRILRRGESVR